MLRTLSALAFLALAACSTGEESQVLRRDPSRVSGNEPAAADTLALAGRQGAASALAPGATAEPDSRPVIVFLGTSLTAGYGLPAEQAYPAVVQQKLDSAGLPYKVVNAGVSGET
ncbi:MAG: arylesterase, partial [Gemmatimonadetes bacterium]|nr:arylesterase [Gemmatimonadota bacterium]